MANYIGNDGFHLEAGSDWTGSAFCSMQMETMHKRLSEGFKFKFPGRQKIIVCRKWVFTKFVPN